MAENNPLAPSELIGHVQDSDSFHVPRFLTRDGSGHIYLPQPLAKVQRDAEGKPVLDHHGRPVYEELWRPHTGVDIVDKSVGPVDLKFTKFMFLELVVALIMCVFF